MLALFIAFVGSLQAQTVTIGTGTTTVAGTNGVPIYRSGTTSTFHHSKSIQLLTAAQLSAAGLMNGSSITAWGYNKTNNGTPSGANGWTLNVYLKNSSNTTLASGTSWTTMISGATLGYTATITSANMPSATGYWMWPISGFTYTGGAIECYIEWFPATTMVSPMTTNTFSWQYTAAGNQAMGTSSATAIPGTQATWTTQARFYNTQITASCLAPTAVTSVIPDCGNNQFSLSVNVTALNGAPSVTVQSDNGNPGGPYSNVGVGTYLLGPYPNGTNVTVTVVHDGSAVCNLVNSGFTYDCATVGRNALSFDGVNDLVNCGAGSTLNITGNTITLEAWIYPTAWRTNVFEGNIINKEGGNAGFMLRAGAGGTLNFALSRQVITPFTAGFTEINSAPGTLALNTWQHVAGTYDGTTMMFFLNGNPVTPVVAPTTGFLIQTTANPMVIGGWSTDASRCFPGKIDDARVWNVAQPPASILANKDLELCGDEAGLVAYYRMNQGIAGGNNAGLTSVTDQTINANNGTISGMNLAGPTSNWVLGKTDLSPCLVCSAPPNAGSITGTATACYGQV